MKIVVLEKMSLGFDVDISFYEEFGEVTYYDTTRPEEIAGRVADADIIIANKAPLNKSTIKDAKNLKLICETATGYNNVDIEYCKAKGIRVTNAVGYSTPIVAQHTFALALYLLEKLLKKIDLTNKLLSHISQSWRARPGVLSDLVILAGKWHRLPAYSDAV